MQVHISQESPSYLEWTGWRSSSEGICGTKSGCKRGNLRTSCCITRISLKRYFCIQYICMMASRQVLLCRHRGTSSRHHDKWLLHSGTSEYRMSCRPEKIRRYDYLSVLSPKFQILDNQKKGDSYTWSLRYLSWHKPQVKSKSFGI